MYDLFEVGKANRCGSSGTDGDALPVSRFRGSERRPVSQPEGGPGGFGGSEEKGFVRAA